MCGMKSFGDLPGKCELGKRENVVNADKTIINRRFYFTLVYYA